MREDIALPDGGRWLSVAPPDGDYPRLALVPADRDHPRLPGSGADADSLGSQVGDYPAFVFSVDDCEATVDRLRDRGVDVVRDPERTPWGVEAAIRDPWGNVYEVVEPRSQS